ncbi:hypothetical protein [Streptomyces albiaxialis]
MDELVALPHPEVTYVADGGGKVTAARRPVRGAAPIALPAVGQIAIRQPGAFRLVEANGLPFFPREAVNSRRSE